MKDGELYEYGDYGAVANGFDLGQLNRVYDDLRKEAQAKGQAENDLNWEEYMRTRKDEHENVMPPLHDKGDEVSAPAVFSQPEADREAPTYLNELGPNGLGCVVLSGQGSFQSQLQHPPPADFGPIDSPYDQNFGPRKVSARPEAEPMNLSPQYRFIGGQSTRSSLSDTTSDNSKRIVIAAALVVKAGITLPLANSMVLPDSTWMPKDITQDSSRIRRACITQQHRFTEATG